MDYVRKLIHCGGPASRGITGKGVGVAVLDTGIFPHIDFEDRIVGNFRQLVSVVAGGNSFRIVQLLLEEQAFDGGHLVLDASLAVFHKKRNCFKF